MADYSEGIRQVHIVMLPTQIPAFDEFPLSPLSWRPHLSHAAAMVEAKYHHVCFCGAEEREVLEGAISYVKSSAEANQGFLISS